MADATLRASFPVVGGGRQLVAPDNRAVDASAFPALYDEHVDFVHRSVRRLGVHPSAVEDAVQEVFLVAYRRLGEFRNASSFRTWLYGIVLNVVRLHRRTTVRAGLHGVIDRAAGAEAEHVAEAGSRRPDAAAETADAWRMLQRVLDELDDDKREVFVLATLEQLSVPEIADILGLKLNTAYSRLRLARAAFDDAVARLNEEEQ